MLDSLIKMTQSQADASVNVIQCDNLPGSDLTDARP